MVLRPDVPVARTVEIGFLAALAVADAVDALLPRQVRATLKWPNDVLVNDGKIAGILVEQAGDALVADPAPVAACRLHRKPDARHPCAALRQGPV